MEFEWDGANEGHCRRHGVIPAEVERAIAHGIVFPNPEHSQIELRFFSGHGLDRLGTLGLCVAHVSRRTGTSFHGAFSA